MLSLLIESGALYCLLWVCVLLPCFVYSRRIDADTRHGRWKMAVVAYQVVSQVQFKSDHPKLNALMAGFDYFLKGCLIPLVVRFPVSA